MKKITLIILVLTIASCSKHNQNFELNGSIKGLKKGIVYLEVLTDSNFVAVDSFKVYDSPEFKMVHNLDHPNLLRLRLNKNEDVQYAIDFFAVKGVTTINTTLKAFNNDLSITGSNETTLYQEYQEMIKAFNSQNLDLIVEAFNAQKSKDPKKVLEIERQQQNLLKRKILFALNFGVNHNDSKVAPFIAVSDLPDVKSPLIDSLYNKLTSKVKKSYYGLKLKEQLNK